MMNTSYERFFETLANTNRLKIIHFLQESGPQSVTDIVSGTKLEQTLVSHHLRRLLRCHFVEAVRNGKERVYSLNGQTIQPLLVLMDKHVQTYCVRCQAKDHE